MTQKNASKLLVAGASLQTLLGSFQRSQRHIIVEFGWDRNPVRIYPSSAKSLIRHWEKMNFHLNYNTADCTVSSMNFQKFSGEGLTEPSPQTPSPAQYLALLLIWASTSNLWRFAPRFGFNPQFTPICLIIPPPPTEGN